MPAEGIHCYAGIKTILQKMEKQNSNEGTVIKSRNSNLMGNNFLSFLVKQFSENRKTIFSVYS